MRGSPEEQEAVANSPRRRQRLVATLGTIAALALIATGSAQASNVIVGNPLTGTFNPSSCGLPCTVTNTALPEAGAKITSPVTGAIVNWHMLKGSSANKYKLRVLTPSSAENTYTGAGTSAAVSPIGAGLETFSTNLPIEAGQAVGIDLEGGAQIGVSTTGVGGAYVFFQPLVVDGASSTGNAVPGGPPLAFNAEVQPAPTVTSVSPPSGSLAGGNGVVISGTDFVNVKSVSFGAIPAQSFGVGSEGQITAIAPAVAGPGPVNVSVTTIAGTTAASAASQFTYTACVVPSVKGKSLKASRKILTAAGCTLGNVKGKKRKAAKVKKQSPKAGSVLAPGSAVNVTLKSRAKKSRGKK